MPHAERTVIVHEPVPEVFAFLANAENDLAWRSGVRQMRLIAGTAGEPGAVYVQRNAGPMGRTIAADIEITKVEPEKSIHFRAIRGPARPEGSYELESVGEGTRVRFQLSWKPKGWRLFMSSMVQKTMESEVAGLDGLEAAIRKIKI